MRVIALSSVLNANFVKGTEYSCRFLHLDCDVAVVGFNKMKYKTLSGNILTLSENLNSLFLFFHFWFFTLFGNFLLFLPTLRVDFLFLELENKTETYK